MPCNERDNMKATVTTATHQLTQEIVAARFEDIPPKALQQVKHSILDDVGIAFMGYTMGGAPLIDYAKDVGGGREESTLIGDGTMVSAIAASAINAQMAYDTDFNETGPGHHILSALAQTAIAIGERVGASGKDVITAVAIGYEMSGRFMQAALPGEQTGNLSSKKQIPMCIAITAGKLLGLDETQLNHALGASWYFSPQPSDFLWRNVWWKRIGMFLIGHCTLGVQSALLAQKGYECLPDIIDREVFYVADRLKSSPSPYYYPAEKLHLKPWISSRGTQTALQAILELVERENVSPEQIEAINLIDRQMYLAFPFNNPEPKEYWDAIYSLQWQYAMAILGYTAGPDWFTSERLSDPKAIALSKKVNITMDSVATDIYTRSRYVGAEFDNYATTVELVANGKTYTNQKTRSETLGSAQNPMSQDQLEAKFQHLAGYVIGNNQAKELVALLANLDNQDNISNITKLFVPI
jgi:2-methylcitrate dehydratase PrpD